MARTGRRRGETDTKTDLIEAGKLLLTENGLGTISLRSIATRAGTTSAMVHFHFGDRIGYLRTLMTHGFQKLLEGVDSTLSFPDAVAALANRLAQYRWLVMLLVQTVYIGDELRHHFHTQHAPALRALYEKLITRGQRDGHVDPRLRREPVIAALISLLIFPHIAGPALSGPLAGGSEDDFQRANIELIQTLFSPREDHNEQ